MLHPDNPLIRRRFPLPGTLQTASRSNIFLPVLRSLRLVTLCCFMLSLAQTAHSQVFNQSFDTSANVWDIIKCDNGEFCTSSKTGFRRYDASGNLLWQRYYNNVPYSATNPSFSWQDQCRLVHTEDDGIIYFSYETTYTNGNNITVYPVAVKLDRYGILVWARKYGVSYYAGVFPLHVGFIKIDARRMENTPSEAYIAVFSGSPAEQTLWPYNQGNALNILSIDGNGNTRWNTRYTEAPGQPYYVFDNAETISYAGEDPDYGNLYFISGTRTEVAVQGMGYDNSWMFKMLIDESGNIIEPYRKMQHWAAYTHSNHAIYDAEQDVIAHSYTIGDTYITGGMEASVMAVETMDRTLHVNWLKYYWKPKSIENYAFRIEKSLVDDSYLVSGFWASDNDYYWPYDAQPATRSTLMKLSPDGDPRFYKHYMTGELTNAYSRGFIVNQHPADPTTESYVFPNMSYAHWTSTPVTVARLLSTDFDGDVCGAIDEEIVTEEIQELKSTTLKYLAETQNYEEDYPLTEGVTRIYPNYCEYAPDDRRRTPAAVPAAASAGTGISLYPTVLHSSEHSVTARFNTAPGLYRIHLLTPDGRTTVVQSADITAANQLVPFETGALVPGIYLVSVTDTAGHMVSTFRVTSM